MNFEERVKWLRGYLSKRRELDDVTRRMVEERARSERVTAQLHAVPVGGSGGDRLQECVAILCELEERWTRLSVESARCLIAIEDAIERVNADDLRLILRRRYLDGVGINALADELHYSSRHIKRLHVQAVNALDA